MINTEKIIAPVKEIKQEPYAGQSYIALLDVEQEESKSRLIHFSKQAIKDLQLEWPDETNYPSIAILQGYDNDPNVVVIGQTDADTITTEKHGKYGTKTVSKSTHNVRSTKMYDICLEAFPNAMADQDGHLYLFFNNGISEGVFSLGISSNTEHEISIINSDDQVVLTTEVDTNSIT